MRGTIRGVVPTTEPLSSSRAALRVDPATGALVRRTCRLEVLTGPESGRRVEVDSVAHIGTSEEATLTLSDPTVSRLHLEVQPRSEGVRVRDLGSTNGTFLTGARIREVLLEEDAVLVVGRTRLRIALVDASVEEPPAQSTFGDAVGRSPAMQRLFGRLELVARSDATVVLHGETGTGKDVLARALHQHSPRARRRFVVVDCSAIAPTVIESELFGHVKGAFSGAQKDRTGLFVEADRGTLFLDEIGELPLSLQSRLLRVLETGEVRRVGDNAPRQVDVRIVAATHRDLEREVADGRFRQDLFFRLGVLMLRVPPLRERREDIPVLLSLFARQLAGRERGFAPELQSTLQGHAWPGNVRQLRNFVERCVAGDADGDLIPEAVVRQALAELERTDEALRSTSMAAPPASPDEGERARIQAALAQCAGNQSAAAKLLGISRRTLVDRLDAFGLPRPRKAVR